MWPPVARRVAVRANRRDLDAISATLRSALEDSSNAFISLPNDNTNKENGDNTANPSTLLEERKDAETSPIKEQLFNTIAIKDNIATAELPTTCGSGSLLGYQSPFEAFVVEQARAYGKKIIGKTNLDEFGMGSHSTNSVFGPVGNKAPFESFSAGGSSGGSAVAVAQHQCGMALGTDTGGSIRLPAAYTGIVGFKPSYGLLSRRGVVPYANSLDTVGILSQSVDEIRKTFLQLQQHDTRDPSSLPSQSRDRIAELHSEVDKKRDATARGSKEILAGFKIGVPVEYNIAELDPAVRKAWQSTLTLLQEQGCTIVPISLPNTKHALSAYYVLAPAEAASNLSKYDGVRYGTRQSSSDGAGDVLYSQGRGDGFGDEVKRRILLGSYTLSSEAIDNYFIKAQKIRRLVQRDFDRIFSLPNPLRPPQQFDLSDMDESVLLENKLGPGEVDFIVCPTAPTTPPQLDDVLKQTSVDAYMNDVFTVPASLAGLPAISVPFNERIPSAEFSHPEGPRSIGIQIIGQYSDDARVLDMAGKFMKLQLLREKDRVRVNNARSLYKKLTSSGVSVKEASYVMGLVESGLTSERIDEIFRGLSEAPSKETASRSEVPSKERESRSEVPIRRIASQGKESRAKEGSYPDGSRVKPFTLEELKALEGMDRAFVDALSVWDKTNR